MGGYRWRERVHARFTHATVSLSVRTCPVDPMAARWHLPKGMLKSIQGHWKQADVEQHIKQHGHFLGGLIQGLQHQHHEVQHLKAEISTEATVNDEGIMACLYGFTPTVVYTITLGSVLYSQFTCCSPTPLEPVTECDTRVFGEFEPNHPACLSAGCSDADPFTGTVQDSGCHLGMCYSGVEDAQCSGVSAEGRYADQPPGSNCFPIDTGTRIAPYRWSMCRK